MARPGIEPRTSDLRVRCPTDNATRTGFKHLKARSRKYLQAICELSMAIKLLVQKRLFQTYYIVHVQGKYGLFVRQCTRIDAIKNMKKTLNTNMI